MRKLHSLYVDSTSSYELKSNFCCKKIVHFLEISRSWNLKIHAAICKNMLYVKKSQVSVPPESIFSNQTS